VAQGHQRAERGSEAGQSWGRRPLRLGAGRERGLLKSRGRDGSAASARAPAAIHGARHRLPPLPPAAAAAKGRARIQARATRRQLGRQRRPGSSAAAAGLNLNLGFYQSDEQGSRVGS
jgi:hypothetical protein